MNDEAFQTRVLKELESIDSVLRNLKSQDCCNQALLMALAEQRNLNVDQLEADYEGNLRHVLEQVPRELQHREIFETFRKGLLTRLTHMRHFASHG